MAAIVEAPSDRVRTRKEESVWIQLVRRGDPFVWMTGGALACAAVMILGMLTLIIASGLGSMWPRELFRFHMKDGSIVVGQIERREAIPSYVAGAGGHRVLVRIGNRDLHGLDFKWFDESTIASRERPEKLDVVERREWGPFYGAIVAVRVGEEVVTEPAAWKRFQRELDPAHERFDRIRGIERGQAAKINAAIENERLTIRRLELSGAAGTSQGHERMAACERRIHEETAAFEVLREKLDAMREEDRKSTITLRSARGETKELAISEVVRAYRPNAMGIPDKMSIYLSRIGEFLTADPRESNTEGGIFPAIFGTVLMTLLMTLAVVPLGVMAALYMREYAKQGTVIMILRIAINNLAGVPSIVFGLFGLGFFGYLMGGAVDHAFFAERLPSPTFGGGGLLWASLTLALLTVPVVIVATEEALLAVPRGIREGSIACGASKFQTITRIVLPSAAPGIMTGAILAMARGAGEVAPLMITGVVKLAPKLPLDGTAPFLHLERKFMHLGFHIYDVGFQSPNVEAAKPMVYTTTLLLILIVVLLNLTAIIVRNKLRDKYRTGTFG
jgi:phosphate transport system permease protein